MKKSTFQKKLVIAAAAATFLLPGCGNSENFVFTNTGIVNAPVVPPAPPIAVNDAYNALGNATVTYSAANGVLSNDTVNGAQISTFNSVGSQGGTLALSDDGSFSYTPIFGFVGSETFSYTLSNSEGDSSATITLTSTGEGFFVNNQAAPGGDGSQASPFDTLAAAVNAAGDGDTIFVSRGNGTNTGLTGAFNLPFGVNLIGEGQGLVLGQTIVPQGQAPVITGPVTCDGSNTISGILFDSEDTLPDCIIVNGVADVTITNNTFRNTTDTYVDCDNVLGNLTIDNNLFEPEDSLNQMIDVDNQDSDATINITNNTFDDDTSTDPVMEAVAVDIEGTSNVNFVFTGNSINGDGTANSFSFGLNMSCADTSTTVFTIDDNIITGVENTAISFDTSDTASSSGSASGNRLTDIGDDALSFEVSGGTTTFANNVIDGTVGEGIDFDCASQGVTFIITGNQIRNAGDNGIDYSDSTASSPVLIAIRNNTVLDSAGEAVTLTILNAVSVCSEITGNTVNDDMVFDDQSTSTLRVEDFANLTTINTFTAGSPQELNGGATPANDGECMIP